MLAGYWVLPEAETGDKITRFGPVSAQCEAGNVKILRAPWNEDFFRCLEGFPEVAHDDDVDAFSGALDLLVAVRPGDGFYENMRRRAAEAIEANRKPEKPPPPPAPGSAEWQALQARGPAQDV
jgi:hypothetical protein